MFSAGSAAQSSCRRCGKFVSLLPSRLLVKLLLIIGGVEENPGPSQRKPMLGADAQRQLLKYQVGSLLSVTVDLEGKGKLSKAVCQMLRSDVVEGIFSVVDIDTNSSVTLKMKPNLGEFVPIIYDVSPAPQAYQQPVKYKFFCHTLTSAQKSNFINFL